jgi:hypothetical protein
MILLISRSYKYLTVSITVDANQDVLGADGEEFVTALQKFMLSFFRSQQGPVGGIEVEMEGEL